ncbi:MAG TPA: NAD(P)/FAD-dependent oxidoreductase [Dehalococcoidia bacterium]|nr:NAD(P)/FAD-dependent oxidoreductase [Dehalococcoidia bacterium]
MEKSIIIIGAGIAGLSAGCYGQMNGYRTCIFEMDNARPGGLCTSWKRKGYTIDGCIHVLTGTAPGTGFYRIWEELGAVQGRVMINHEEYVRIEGEGGKVFIVHADINRLEQHMKELAPEDQDVIAVFIKAIHSFTRFDMPIEKAPELYGTIDGLRMMFTMFPNLRLMRKWGRISVQDFAKSFKNPFLREAFSLTSDIPDFPMTAMLMLLAMMHLKTAGYPVGGSLEFARAIEQRYFGLGGEVHYKSRVARILVKNDQVVGVRLADGTEHRSDIVISAADGRTTIFDMLDGKYINDKIQGYYDKLPLVSPLIHIGLGVIRSFDELPHSVIGINYPLDEPVTIGGKELKRMGAHIYNFDPSLAPAGKTLVRLILNSDYEYWNQLNRDPERYKAEKEQIADKVIALLDQRFPGLADQVEVRDVATPITFERYTGNWQGSYQGWQVSTKTMGMRMSKTLPGLKNFYMAGKWVEPGGTVPMAAMSGRNVTQIICKRDKKQFITSTP